MAIYNGNQKVKPSGIGKVYVGSTLVYESSSITGDLYFEATSSSTVGYNRSGLAESDIEMEYSINGASWQSWDGTAISLASGDKMYVRNNHATLSVGLYNYFNFVLTGSLKAVGNIMALLNGATSITQNYSFVNLFDGQSALTDISGLELPATTLADGCYKYMFYGCTGLTSLPSNLLPATTLVYECYHGMFYNCSGITSIPSGFLSATSLAEYCCIYMFRGCTSLTNLPANLLPATTLANKCYSCMFYDCTSLNVSEGSGTRLIFTCPSTSGLTGPTEFMFHNTAGSFTGAPTAGNSYYNN